MNDDLENQLARWRPADPPPDLLRRLRAAEPASRPSGIWSAFAALIDREGRIRWPRIAAGFAAITVVASVGWIVFSALSAGTTTRINDRTTLSSPHASEQENKMNQDARRVGGGGEVLAANPLDLSHFMRSGLRYAVLDASPDAGSTNRLPLDTPVGPIRLDCGYTLPAHELGDYPFSPFYFNARDRF